MKPYRMAGFSALLAGVIFAQQAKIAPAAQAPGVEKADDREMLLTYADEIRKLKPAVSNATLDHNSRLYLDALPDVRKALADKSCAGNACSPVVLHRAVFETYLNTLQLKDFGQIQMADVAEIVAGTSYIYVWSNPETADFKLLQGAITAWAEKTNHGKFVLKSDYTLHIEKPGYEPFDGPCSNKKDRGVSCGGALKKKN